MREDQSLSYRFTFHVTRDEAERIESVSDTLRWSHSQVIREAYRRGWDTVQLRAQALRELGEALE